LYVDTCKFRDHDDPSKSNSILIRNPLLSTLKNLALSYEVNNP